MGQSLASQAKNVKLVLLSRSGLPPRERWDELRRSAVPGSTLEYQLAGVKAMEERGADVLTLQADVTDPLELEAALARARKRFGRISGLFVAMKQLYHKPVEDLAEEEFRAGLMNRVRGTWLLDSLTREDDLDFLVLISSISSILGTRTASECCAVNQFLDAYAPFSRAHGRQVSSLNLTLILDDRRDFRGPTPIPPLDFRQFKGCFEHFLGHQPPLAVVARFDAAEVSYLLPVLRVPFAPELLVDLGVSAARQQAESLPATLVVPIAIASAELEARLRALWKEILGEEPRSRDDGFFALGGTSLTALKLVQVVRQSFGVAFEPADVFANSTIGGMTRFIAEQLAPTVDPLASVLDGVESGDLSVEAALSALGNSGR
jgi:acyl carrier protein